MIDTINNNADFNAAVQKYKNVVTRYLASKMEIWFALFMKEFHGVDCGVLSFEYYPSRGAIHYHKVLYTAKDEGFI